MLRCMKKCSQLLNEIDNEQVTWNLVFMQSAERIPYDATLRDSHKYVRTILRYYGSSASNH